MSKDGFQIGDYRVVPSENHCEFYYVPRENTEPERKLYEELEAEVQQLKEQLTREVAVRDDIYAAAHYKWNMLKQRAINYKFDKNGSHEDGRYCVAISVTDLLKWMEEIEGGK